MRHLKIVLTMLCFWLISPTVLAKSTAATLTYGLVESFHTDDRGQNVLRFRLGGNLNVETLFFSKYNTHRDVQADIMGRVGQYVTIRFDTWPNSVHMVKPLIPFDRTQTVKKFGYQGIVNKTFINQTTYYTGQIFRVVRIQRSTGKMIYRHPRPSWKRIPLPGLCQIQMATAADGIQFFQTEVEDICKAAEDMLVSQQPAGIRVAPKVGAMIQFIEPVSRTTGNPLNTGNIMQRGDGIITETRSWFP